MFGNGTSAVGATAVGSDGQLLTSNGSGSAPTFQDAAGGGGAWAVAASGVLSGASSLDITDITKTTQIIFSNIIFATQDTYFIMRTSTDNGSNFAASSGDYEYNYEDHVGGGGSTIYEGANANFTSEYIYLQSNQIVTNNIYVT